MELKPTKFSVSFAAQISVALGADSEYIQGEVEAGIAQAWLFTCDGKTLGYAVTRLEPETLVVVAYQGENVNAFGDMIVRIAEAKGLLWTRFHTQRSGLIKLLADFNPEPLEYVVRIKAHGRT